VPTGCEARHGPDRRSRLASRGLPSEIEGSPCPRDRSANACRRSRAPSSSASSRCWRSRSGAPASGTDDRSPSPSRARPRTPAPAATASPSPAVILLVDVAGWVRHPGVYEFDEGARVIDAIEAAGGPRPGALLTSLNLAAPLTDGSQILVPKEADQGSAPIAG